MRSSALIDNAAYQFGDFTPAADNPSGIDSDGLAGASIYDTTFGPGAQVVDGQTTYDLNNLNLMLADGNQIEITTVPGEFTNFLEVTANDTANWIENAAVPRCKSLARSWPGKVKAKTVAVNLRAAHFGASMSANSLVTRPAGHRRRQH